MYLNQLIRILITTGILSFFYSNCHSASKYYYPSSLSNITGGNTYCINSPANALSVTVTNSVCGASGGFTNISTSITWYRNTTNTTSGGVVVSGPTASTTATTTFTYTPSTTSAGTYYYYFEITFSNVNVVPGCSSGNVTSTVGQMATVIINDNPTTADAGTDISQTCTTTATLAGNTPVSGTGSWSVISGTATITDPASPTSGVTGLVVGTSATLRWTISNSPCTASTDGVVITVNSGPGCVSYCTPTYTNACTSNDYIENFSTTGGTTNITNNTSGCNGQVNNYNYYSAMSVTQTDGSTFDFSIQSGASFGQGFHIWIDWNGDGDFSDTDEDVWNSVTSGTTNYTGTITIPLGTSSGTKRMRVRCSYNAVPSDPCGNEAYGETEDYNVEVTASGPMTFSSSTTTQGNTSSVMKCNTDQQVIGIEVVTTGTASPIALTQFQVNMTGSTIAGTNTNDVSKIHVYYTGTSSVFSATGAFDGIGTNVASGTITINGSQTLSSGTNYFWIAYDINSVSATVGNVIDAQCTQITVEAVNQVPTSTSPAGTRPIIICNPSPGGVSTGLETWIKADIGVTGASPITAWDNQNPSGTDILVHGSPVLNTTSQTYNYNPYVEFSGPAGTLSSGWAANREFLYLDGYTDLAGINYTSLFFAIELDDLTRVNTHIATVGGVTFGSPVNGTFHGDDNAGTSSINLEAYDITDFGTSAPAGTWRRNGLNIASNSVHSSVKHVLSANCQTGGSTTLNTFLGGQWDQLDPNSFAGHIRDWKGPCAEIIGYTTAMTATDRQKIDSYLAIKYGMTLTFDYLSTSGGTIFTVAAPYNSNIIGIGRDDVESLTQKQSHNDDDSVRVYVSTLMLDNASNSGSFSSDISYIMTGATTGKLCSTTTSDAEMPAACALYSRIEREWKVTRTNNSENFNVDIKLADCGVPGSVTISHLRLLIDDDGNFTNGGTTCYASGDVPGFSISYSNPTITFTGITSAMIPDNSTMYITIGSVEVITPLPVELLLFEAKEIDDKEVYLDWKTASEINSDYFQLERSQNGSNWEIFGRVEAAGNSTNILNYQFTDKEPYTGLSYYRLAQYDTDGSTKLSQVEAVSIDQSRSYLVYPIPAGDIFYLTGDKLNICQLQFTNGLGQAIPIKVNIKADNLLEIVPQTDVPGVYFLEIIHSGKTETIKVLMSI